MIDWELRAHMARVLAPHRAARLDALAELHGVTPLLVASAEFWRGLGRIKRRRPAGRYVGCMTNEEIDNGV